MYIHIFICICTEAKPKLHLAVRGLLSFQGPEVAVGGRRSQAVGGRRSHYTLQTIVLQRCNAIQYGWGGVGESQHTLLMEVIQERSPPGASRGGGGSLHFRQDCERGEDFRVFTFVGAGRDSCSCEMTEERILSTIKCLKDCFAESIPTQIRQRNLHVSNRQGYVDGCVGELTSAKRLSKHFAALAQRSSAAETIRHS